MISADRLLVTGIFAAWLTAQLGAQTLPPSTQDRQAIANLEYQLSLPGVSPESRRAIQLQITRLQYQINTRSPVQPLPTLAPAPPQTASAAGYAPESYTTATAPNQIAVPAYGSCRADSSVLQYLQSLLSSPSIGYDERVYIKHSQLNDVRHQMSERRCT
jgi:hypothetical protein